MQTQHNKRAKGFAQIPNAILDDPSLCLRNKMVLCLLKSYAFGVKTWANPAQLTLATSLGVNVKTIRAALESLEKLGYITPHGNGRPGAIETYTLNLSIERTACDEEPLRLTTATCPIGDRQPVHPVDTNKTSKENPKEYAALTAFRGTMEPDVITVAEGTDSLGSLGGDDLLCSQGIEPEPVRLLDRFRINDLLLTPNGEHPDESAIDADLYAQMAFAYAEPLNDNVLKRLIEAYGARRCAFWSAWILRKIAAEHEAGRPVKNPAGLYRRAVEGGWQVDPGWPEYDEHKHRLQPQSVDDDYDGIPF